MKKMFLFAMLTILMGACTEYIEDATLYTADPEGLVIHVTDSNSLFGINEAEGSTRAVYNGITTSFENGDSIGIYAVQGSTVKHSNIKVVYNSGVWVPTDFIKFNKNYTYYAYFPYRSTGLSNNFALSGVDNIFAAGISAWPISTDQSIYQNFKNCDLMLAAGVNTSDNIISFTMQHKMAMAVINNQSQATYSYSTDPTNKITIANSFVDKIPYLNVTNNKYYYIIKPNTSTNIGGTEFQVQTGKYIEKNVGDMTETYTITYSTDGGQTYSTTKPSWVENVIETRDSGEPLNFCFFVNDSKTTNTQVGYNTYATENHINFEKATPVIDYDLSTEGGTKTMNTANCYMVHAPGTYKLPLVYGNAIKNGQLNEIAYKPGVSGNGVKSVFVNHNNDPITAPWITKSTNGTGINKGMNISVDHSGVAWQTAERGITSIEVDGDYLKFTVKKDLYRTQHAVVAIYDNNNDVIWSWFIWITGEKWDDLITVIADNHTYHVAPTPLGWTGKPRNRREYQGSTCKVQISTSSTLAHFNLVQPNNLSYEVMANSCGTYPFFQWGRKDPYPAFVPNGAATTLSSWQTYSTDESGTHTSVAFSTNFDATTISAKIKNPLNFGHVSSNDYSWATDLSLNMWDATQTDVGVNTNGTIKTVYDPCPPGFCVPSAGFWQFFSEIANPTYVNETDYLGAEFNGNTILNNNNTLRLPFKSWYNYNFSAQGSTSINIWFSNIGLLNTYQGYYLGVSYNSGNVTKGTATQINECGRAILAVAEGE